MTPDSAEHWLAERVAAVAGAAKANGRHVVAVLAEQGLGDTARAIAIAAAWRQAVSGDFIVLLTHYDGTMVKRDMAHAARQAGIIQAYIEAPSITYADRQERLTRGRLVHVLTSHCDVLVDAMCVVPRLYARTAQEQAVYGHSPHDAIYDGYPHDTWRLTYVDQPWWDLASQELRVEIDPGLLRYAVPSECAPWPTADELPPGATLEALIAASGSADCADAELTDKRPYITIHHGAGGGAKNVKVPPRRLLDAVVRAAQGMGLQVVQLGTKHEPRLLQCAYKTDLRLPLVVKLLQGAVAHVDNDSFLPYIAQGMHKPCIVFFGPTPRLVYGLPGNLNVRPGLNGKACCPLRSCFGGGQWGAYDGWWVRCRVAAFDQEMQRDMSRGREPACMNFPRPADAAATVVGFLRDKVPNA